jgi:uncharacterized membrane protein YtjA (UPF0391 family)
MLKYAISLLVFAAILGVLGFMDLVPSITNPSQILFYVLTVVAIVMVILNVGSRRSV